MCRNGPIVIFFLIKILHGLYFYAKILAPTGSQQFLRYVLPVKYCCLRLEPCNIKNTSDTETCTPETATYAYLSDLPPIPSPHPPE